MKSSLSVYLCVEAFAVILQVLEGVELDFSRYGETLFEVLFAGGRMAAGGNVVLEKENKRLEYTVSRTVTLHYLSLELSAQLTHAAHNSQLLHELNHCMLYAGNECRARQGVNPALHQDVSAVDQVST